MFVCHHCRMVIDTDLADRHDVENLRRSIAMEPAGLPVLSKSDSLAVLDALLDALADAERPTRP